jgi:hypothetical protein
LEDRELVLLDERLFSLDMPEQKNLVSKERLAISHRLYPDVTAHREVTCLGGEIQITDWWQGEVDKNYATVWNFVLAPEVQVEKVEGGLEIVLHSKELMLITSDLEFVVENSWFSGEYGSKTPCKKIRAKEVISSEQKIKTVFRLR